MKIIQFLRTLLLFSLLISCSAEQQQTEETNKSETLPDLPQVTDEYLTRLFELQELIRIFPDDRDLRTEYVRHAWLKDSGYFISLGFGTLHDPGTGGEIPEQFYRRAAGMDAARWAAYGESWLNNNFEPAFGKLDAAPVRTGRELRSTVLGDSLFLFIATPLVMK